MSDWRVEIHDDAAAFLSRAGDWLLSAEAENNLLLGLAERLRNPDHGFDPPILLATVESASGDVAGCVFRTPPFKLGLTRLPLDAMSTVVDAVAEAYDSLPAVLGPDAEIRAFATAWSALRGVEARAGMRQGIYALERVEPPARMPPGALREGTADDLSELVDWAARFTEETGVSGGGPERLARRLLASRDLFVWDDGGPACMAAASAYTPHGARIGWVYTPSDRRGRGYASACVAALSELLLARGLRQLFLYTDLANPTSNSIYQRIGYRPILDVGDIEFS